MSDEIQKNSMLLKELQTLSQSIVNAHDSSKSEIEMKIAKTEEFTGVLQTNILEFKKKFEDRMQSEAINSQVQQNWVSEIASLASETHKLQDAFRRGMFTPKSTSFLNCYSL